MMNSEQIEAILNTHRAIRARGPNDDDLILKTQEERIEFNGIDDRVILTRRDQVPWTYSNGKHVMPDHVVLKRNYYWSGIYLQPMFTAFDWQKYHVVLAGGAVLAKAIHTNTSDFDFFFYDLTSEQIIENVNAIYNDLKQYYIIKVYRTSSVVTMNIDGNVLQFVLRRYRNKAEIIYGFDLPAGQLLYDGKEIYTTVLGNLALSLKCNIVDIETRRHNYERRLFKYMKNYGFSIIMPKCIQNMFDLQNIAWLGYDNLSQISQSKHFVVSNPRLLYSAINHTDSYNFNIDYHSDKDINFKIIREYGRKNPHYITFSMDVTVPVMTRKTLGNYDKLNEKVDLINNENITVPYYVLDYDEKSAYQDLFKTNEVEWCTQIRTPQEWKRISIHIIHENKPTRLAQLIESIKYADYCDIKFLRIFKYQIADYESLIEWAKDRLDALGLSTKDLDNYNKYFGTNYV